MNGCSFTAGDNVVKGETWPEKLAKELDLKLHQDARNGNSMESIFHLSLDSLSKFNPKDTLVIIGTTWKERYSVPYWEGIFNITPADLGNNKEIFQEKASTYRRISSPVCTHPSELTALSKELTMYPKNFKEFNEVLKRYAKFYESLVEYDRNLDYNQSFFHFNYILSLENFLKRNNFTYKFIDFQEYFSLEGQIKKHSKINSYLSIDRDNIINMGWNAFSLERNKSAHPSAEDCTVIAKLIKERL